MRARSSIGSKYTMRPSRAARPGSSTIGRSRRRRRARSSRRGRARDEPRPGRARSARVRDARDARDGCRGLRPARDRRARPAARSAARRGPSSTPSCGRPSSSTADAELGERRGDGPGRQRVDRRRTCDEASAVETTGVPVAATLDAIRLSESAPASTASAPPRNRSTTRSGVLRSTPRRSAAPIAPPDGGAAEHREPTREGDHRDHAASSATATRR